eukprot:scaffold25360_cov122-Isochrysis_galbana.AAC.4
MGKVRGSREGGRAGRSCFRQALTVEEEFELTERPLCRCIVPKDVRYFLNCTGLAYGGVHHELGAPNRGGRGRAHWRCSRLLRHHIRH